MEKKRLRNINCFNNSKKGQAVFGISFSVIFAVILIIVFIILAIIIIKYFLNTSDCASVGLFIKGFEDKVETSYKAQKVSGKDALYEETLPRDIDYVCFIDFSKIKKGIHQDKYKDAQLYLGEGYNLFFWPLSSAGDCGLEGTFINHLNIEDLIKVNNPYCFPNQNKVKIQLEKGFNDKDVRVLK